MERPVPAQLRRAHSPAALDCQPPRHLRIWFPTLPRTPEAIILHHIDNIDAKYEMFKQAYNVAPELAPGIQQKQFPLPANLVTPLAHFPKDAEAPRPAAATKVSETSTEPVEETPKPKLAPKKSNNRQFLPLKLLQS